MPVPLLYDRRTIIAVAAAEALDDKSPDGRLAADFISQLFTAKRALPEFAHEVLGWTTEQARGATHRFRAVMKGFFLAEKLSENFDLESATPPRAFASNLPDAQAQALKSAAVITSDRKNPIAHQVYDRLLAGGMRGMAPALVEAIRNFDPARGWSFPATGDEGLERQMASLAARLMVVRRETSDVHQQNFTYALAISASAWSAAEWRLRNEFPAETDGPVHSPQPMLRRAPHAWADGSGEPEARWLWRGVPFGTDSEDDATTRATLHMVTGLPVVPENRPNSIADVAPTTGTPHGIGVFWHQIDRTEHAANRHRSDSILDLWKRTAAIRASATPAAESRGESAASPGQRPTARISPAPRPAAAM